MNEKLYIGTAGWAIDKKVRSHFPDGASLLERYSKVFNCVEINSAFHREHKPDTYVKWAAAVPEHFRFSIKLSRYFTHDTKLAESGTKLKEVLSGISGLGEKWGVLLIQLPPKLEFDSRTAGRFFREVRKHFGGEIVCEPRHLSWISEEARDQLVKNGVSKVLADPEPCQTPREMRPALERVRYLRLHGSPDMYRSSYPDSVLARVALSVAEPISPADQTWCIFDNTGLGHATANALFLQERLRRSRQSS